VTDLNAYPVGGALVVVRQGSAILFRARTPASGETWFHPYDDEEGPFRVDALAFGYMPASAPAVAAGAVVELRLVARPAVVGEVVAAARGGKVTLYQGDVVRRTRIEADGSFAFYELDEGEAVVQAEVEPFGADAETVFLRAGETRRVRLRIREGEAVRIEGELEAWPGRGALWVNGNPVPVSATGRFVFDRAIVGVNEVVVDAPGRALFQERFQVRTGLVPRPSFRLPKESAIRGRVRSARTQRPIQGAEVRVGIDWGNPRNEKVPLFPIERVPLVRTEADGRFEIPRLDSRLLYRVSVLAPGFGQALVDAIPGSSHLGVELPEGPYLFGFVRGIGGVPRDAQVTARPIGDPPRRLRFNVEEWDVARGARDAKGFYGLSGLLPGTYLLRVDAPGFGSVETVVEFLGGERARLDLRLRRGDEIDEEEAELLARLPPVYDEEAEARPPGDRTLLLVDVRRPRDKPPFRAVRVEFFHGEDEYAPPLEISGEEFQLPGLPEGRYRALLHHPTLRQPIVREPVVLKRGEATSIRMGSE